MMLGTFFALITIMCFNIYIALLSETFIRVYNNAKAFAVQDQAKTILNIENVVSRKRKLNADRYIQESCNPLVSSSLLSFFVRKMSLFIFLMCEHFQTP